MEEEAKLKIYPIIEIDGSTITPHAGHKTQQWQVNALRKSGTIQLLDGATYRFNEHGHLVVKGCPIGQHGSHRTLGKRITITMSHFTIIEDGE